MSDAVPIMQRLRDETAELHKLAESRPLEQQMISGRLPRESYATWLGQRYLMHRALDRALEALRASDPRLAGVLGSEQYQSSNAESDLRALGVEPRDVAPLAPTRSFVSRLERGSDESPVALLGVHYVFEGSKNGARYIARAMRGALSPVEALRYLDPHGPEQRPLWDAFKQKMNAVAFSPAEQDEMLAAAKEAFAFAAALDDAVFARASAAGPATVA